MDEKMTAKEMTDRELKETVERGKKSANEYGLDFPEIIFHRVGFEELHEMAAYGGFPNRYPHYRWGVEYEKLSKSYQYGIMKIYEMVVNTDPCHAYLLKGNLGVDMKIVIAHVYGHADFFKNNYCFGHTNRKMLDEIANHCSRIERYIDRFGQDKIEDFITQCFSLENLIDMHSPYIKRHEDAKKTEDENEKKEDNGRKIPRLQYPRRYLDHFINPVEWQKEMEEILKQKAETEKEKRIGLKIPLEPERDILLFLLNEAPLEIWEQDILSIIREEAYYFFPQGQTKIMNEGWATYWHSKIMTGGEVYKTGEPPPLLTGAELIDYATHHSGAIASHGKINPYRLGLFIWKDIEERWNKGRFGPEWEECLRSGGLADIKNFDRKLGQGRQKMFEVRKYYNDVNFISEFLTDELIKNQKLFHVQKYGDHYLIDDFEANKIRKRLLFQLTNFGDPILKIEDSNYKKEGILYIKHYWEGVPLDLEWANKVLLQALFNVWKRPVYVETVIMEEKEISMPIMSREERIKFPQFPKEAEGKVAILKCDGKKIDIEKTDKSVKVKSVI